MAISNRVRLRADDIWDAPDDGKTYEVIDGRLFVSPAPIWLHQRFLGQLFLRLGTHVYDRGLGEVVTAPIGVALDEENGIQPDLIFVSRDRLGIISERGVEGAPDLVVEVLSPSTEARDRGIKFRRYAAAGVAHYWITSLRPIRVETFRLGENGYEPSGVFGAGDVLRSELFPGLEIPIDEFSS